MAKIEKIKYPSGHAAYLHLDKRMVYLDCDVIATERKEKMNEKEAGEWPILTELVPNYAIMNCE